MTILSWNLDAVQSQLIDQIVDRAMVYFSENGMSVSPTDLRMDLFAVQIRGDVKLDLMRLRDTDRFNFMHDVQGIREHLCRDPGADQGKLLHCFVPRMTLRNKEVFGG